jgi:hypothetical protein
LLYKLIRLKTAIPAPTDEWDNQPSPGHIKKTEDIERIRLFRKKFSHISVFQICDKDFSTRWTDISQVK